MQRLRLSLLIRPALLLRHGDSVAAHRTAAHGILQAAAAAAAVGAGRRQFSESPPHKWNDSPLSNPWGRGAGDTLQKALPKAKLKKGAKPPKPGSGEWRTRRQQINKMKDGITVCR